MWDGIGRKHRYGQRKVNVAVLPNTTSWIRLYHVVLYMRSEVLC